MEIKKQVDSLRTELIELRRDFHKHPELGFEEWRTSEVISDYLRSIGLEVKQGIAKTGVVGLLEGKKAGRTLLLRADMDALPIQEENKIPYKSVNEGKMHACGHDGHSAMLLVAAKVLSQHKDEISGNIKFVFQPAEETSPGGAKSMIEEGVLEAPHVDAALGLHLNTPLESGKLAISVGPIMAAINNFKLTIEGKGGHTGYPHSAVDPIIAAANIITTTQIIQTREIDVFKPMLIMFGRIQGGSSECVIPGKVELEGTIRYLYEGGEEDVGRFERIIEGICKAHRTRYELKLVKAADSLNNDSRLVELVKACAEKLVRDQNIVSARTMGAEDFSEFSQKVPSAFYFIGTGNKEKETDYPHHHPRFNIDESTLPTGVEMHVRTALAYLSSENV